MKTRKEHLDWCKQRALEYVEAGDCPNAVASMSSDLNKHSETEGHPGIALSMIFLMDANSLNERDVRKWIEGFN